MSKTPIVITGFMGCGKSEVARCLARQLEVEMIDLDEMIAKLESRTPAQLILEEGELAFRKIETKTLASILARRVADVIALGGGAWIECKNRELLEQASAISVWLDTPFEVCWSRIETDPKDRPLGKTNQQASELHQHRRPIYQLARVHIEVTGKESPDELAATIQSELRKETFN